MISYPAELEPSTSNLGGKGISLITMDAMGLNVPSAYIMPVNHKTGTQRYYAHRDGIIECFSGLHDVLYSVRSGAPTSMPGMCDTFLHVGLTVNKWKRLKAARGDDFAVRVWNSYIKQFQENTLPKHQIMTAADAVADSWNSDKAKAYREKFNVPDTGTAIILQQMVFGIGENSGSGVFFSHDLTTGAATPNGAYVHNEAGEALVNGTNTGIEIKHGINDKEYPWHDELMDGVGALVEHYKAPVDVEFTVDSGVLYFLQARAAKLTARAKVRNHKMKNVKVLPTDLDACAISTLESNAKADLKGKPIAGGATKGKIALTEGKAKTYIKNNTPFIYAREDTTPEDLPVMLKAEGLITQVGSHTSHAALCARALNMPCIINVSLHNLKDGMTISMCGSTGRIVYGIADIIPGGLPSQVLEATRAYMLEKYPSGTAFKAGDLWGDAKLPAKFKVINSKEAMGDFESMLEPTDSHKLAQIKHIYGEDIEPGMSNTKAIQAFLGKVEKVLEDDTNATQDVKFMEEIVLEALNA